MSTPAPPPPDPAPPVGAPYPPQAQPYPPPAQPYPPPAQPYPGQPYPPPGPPSVGQPPYGYAGRAPTNQLAIVAFVVALVSFWALIPFFINLILGYAALRQIRRSGEEGRAFALTAVVLGWVGAVPVILMAIGGIVYGVGSLLH